MRIQQILLPIAMCCLVAGCGPGRPGTVPVSGRVTWQGKPVVTGRITFYPTTGRPATSPIGPDGGYCLRTFEPGDGTVVGKHCVTIDARRVIDAKAAPKTRKEKLPGGMAVDPEAKLEWLVPEKYSQRSTSPLTAEVTADQKPIDFALP
jgi:hypothetical protein